MGGTDPQDPFEKAEQRRGQELSPQEVVETIDDLVSALDIGDLNPPTAVRSDVRLPTGYDISNPQKNSYVLATFDRISGVNKMMSTTPEQLGVPLDATDFAESGQFHKIWLELKNLSLHNPDKTGPIVVAGTEARKVEPNKDPKQDERMIASSILEREVIAGDGTCDDEYQAAISAACAQDGFEEVHETNRINVSGLEHIGFINGRPVFAFKLPYEIRDDGKYKVTMTHDDQLAQVKEALGAGDINFMTSNTYIPTRRSKITCEGLYVTGYGASELKRVKGEDITNEIAQALAELELARRLALQQLGNT